MDSSVLDLAARGTLREAYDTLRSVNENLQTVEADLFYTSAAWTLFQGSSDKSDPPEHWVDPNRTTFSPKDKDWEAWAHDSKGHGLFDSKLAIIEELNRLGNLKRDVEDMQKKIRLIIDKLSRPVLGSCHVLDLPDEILSQVFDFVQGLELDAPTLWHLVSKDIKNCRLTCHAFNRVGSRMLLRSIAVDFSALSISRFKEISNHPIISKGVRVVRAVLHFYDPQVSQYLDDFITRQAQVLEEQLETMEDLRTWEWSKIPEDVSQRALSKVKAVLESWYRISNSMAPETPRQLLLTEEDQTHLALLKTTHQKYQKLCSDQEELWKSGEFLQIVAAGIARMPRARILYLLDRDDLRPKRGSLFDCEDINVPIYNDMLRPINYYTASTFGCRPRLCDTLTKLPLALQNSGVSLEKAYITLSHIDPPSDLLPSPEVQQQLPSGMHRLEEFSFQCRNWVNGDSGQEVLDNILSPFLNTPSLRNVVIDLTKDEESNENQPIFNAGRLITLQKWENLSYFFLQDVDFHLSDFRLFIGSPHAPDLNMTLERVRLLSGTWEEMLDILREKSCRKIGIHGPLGAEGDNMSSDEFANIFGNGRLYGCSKAEEYITKMIEKNPFRDRPN